MRLIKFIYFIAFYFTVSGNITSLSAESLNSKDDRYPQSRHSDLEVIKKNSYDLDIGPLVRLIHWLKNVTPSHHPLYPQAFHNVRNLKLGAETLDNRYVSKAIIPPLLPNRQFSAGIFQDGNDYTYFGEVSLGSQSSKVYMLLDTGADSSWVMGTGCEDPICTSRETFGGQNSSTFEASDTRFSVNYGSGSCSGFLAKDTVSFAGFSFKMPFGVATMVSKEFANFEIYGILGLSFSKSKTPSFIDSVVASKILKRNLFGISLSQTKDGNNTGVINFGSPDSTRFVGDLKYYPLTGDKNDWKIEMNAAGFGKEQIPMGKITLLDTGATNIFAPLDVTKNMYTSIPGAESKDNGFNWQVPCDTAIDLVFKFGSDLYTLSPAIWVGPPTTTDGQCWSNLSGTDQTNGEWVLGDFFLKNYYVVFDIDNRKIGIASVKIPTPSTIPSPFPTEDGPRHGPTEDSGPPNSDLSPRPGINMTSPEKSDSTSIQNKKIFSLYLSLSIGSAILLTIF